MKETITFSAIQLVGVKLGEEEYGVEIEKIKEIIIVSSLQVTFVPRVEHFYEGVVNIRGEIVPIINLRTKLSLSGELDRQKARVIVVEIEGFLVGFLVDGVTGVLKVPRDTIEEAPSTIGYELASYLKGIGRCEEKFVPILDLEKLIEKELEEARL